jgi:hypothetical protein
MQMSDSISRRAIHAGLGALLSAALCVGWVGPANAQENQDQQPAPDTGVTEPVPLITVRPGPALPNLPPPEPPSELLPLPAAYAQPVGPFTMNMEVLVGGGPSIYGLFAAPGCTLDGVFKRGMKLVWRFEVYDMDSRMRLTDREGAEVGIQLPDGTFIPARFEQRGEPGRVAPDAPWTWVAAWNIPLDTPLGPVPYRVIVSTPDGRSAGLAPTAMGSPFPIIVD